MFLPAAQALLVTQCLWEQELLLDSPSWRPPHAPVLALLSVVLIRGSFLLPQPLLTVVLGCRMMDAPSLFKVTQECQCLLRTKSWVLAGSC